MKKLTFWLVLALLPVILNGQVKRDMHVIHKDCEGNPSLVDSLYAYNWDSINRNWVPVAIRLYESSSGRYDRLVFINPLDRKSIRAWDYYYDDSGNRNLEISSRWATDKWIVNLKKESNFDFQNKKLDELRNYYKNEKWNFVSYAYYEYNGDRIDKVHLQQNNSEGLLSDVSYSEYIYEFENLAEVRKYEGDSSLLVGSETYKYDVENNKLSERIFYNYEIDDNGDGRFMPFKRQLYFYDDLLLLKEIIFQELNMDQWEAFSKYEYFYKIDNAKKVAICHNGHTICVSVNAVKAHLAHGDSLGECDQEEKHSEKNRREKKELKNIPFIVYPNPARERIRIKFDHEKCDDLTRVELVDPFGKTLKSYKVNGKREITIPRGNLKNGSYYLKVIGDEVYSTIVIFK